MVLFRGSILSTCKAHFLENTLNFYFTETLFRQQYYAQFYLCTQLKVTPKFYEEHSMSGVRGPFWKKKLATSGHTFEIRRTKKLHFYMKHKTIMLKNLLRGPYFAHPCSM